MRYTQEFKEQMVRKLLGPNRLSLKRVSRESGVAASTLYNWRKEAKSTGVTSNSEINSSKRWTPEAKMRVLLEAAGLGEQERGLLLRREGLHDADLERFRQDLVGAASPKARSNPVDKKRIKELERDLRRKDKALAEATALVVLSKKLNAYFEEVEVGDTADPSEK